MFWLLLHIWLRKFGCQFYLECLKAGSSQAPSLRNDPHWSLHFSVYGGITVTQLLRNRKGAGDHLDAEEVGPIVSIEVIPSASWWPPCPVGDGSKTSIHWLPPRSLLHFQFAKKLGCTWIMSFLFSMYDFRAICGKMNFGLTCSVHVIIITLNLRGGVKGGEATETWQYDKWGRGEWCWWWGRGI